ncbi:P-loop NTPase family protein [Oceanobacillus jeddahense]|uniref:Topology modulation protein n=1 Tax=Oceanobacillus jeddahense TaxID=1462527 RepID=A0ABY5JPY4_9BACI|nr:topology modulation protein [Oceanobacillus jeddahense]UUI01223.1 topology modulation protein [Oceanobacillus jeddahense]
MEENKSIVNRIIVIGCPGAGKSTLSTQIAQIRNIPLVHLDSIQWIDDDTTASKAAFDTKLNEEIKKDKWIIDGNYARTLELRMKHADWVIWLDFPRSVCLYRIFKRYIKNRGKKSPHGNPDRLDFSFLRFVWNYKKENNSRIKSLKDKHQGRLRFSHIRSGRELRKFMSNLETQRS